MSTPILDQVTQVIGEGPLLRRIRRIVRRIRERVRGIIIGAGPS